MCKGRYLDYVERHVVLAAEFLLHNWHFSDRFPGALGDPLRPCQSCLLVGSQIETGFHPCQE